MGEQDQDALLAKLPPLCEGEVAKYQEFCLRHISQIQKVSYLYDPSTQEIQQGQCLQILQELSQQPKLKLADDPNNPNRKVLVCEAAPEGSCGAQKKGQ